MSTLVASCHPVEYTGVG